MSNLTSTLSIVLKDGVSGPAKTVSAALKDAERNAKAVATGMGKIGSTPFKNQLSGLKLTAKELRAVKGEWLSYAKVQKAALGANWATQGAAAMRAWEKQAVSSIRKAKAEQMAFNKSLTAAGAGQVAAGRLGRLRAGASDFASYALPGAAGMALGLGAGAAGGLAVGGATAFALKQAISFDKAMADVRKKVTLGVGESLVDVERMINRNALKFGIAREDMAALAAQAGQSGIAFKDLAGFMELAAKVSAAWDISAKDAAESLANVRAQTQWSNEQLATYANKVNFLGDVSASAEKNINTMWGRASAGAKASGLTYDEAMIGLTAANAVGMDPEVAARAFGQLTARLRTATSQTGVPSALARLGLDAKDVEKRMQTHGLDTVIDFLDRLSKSKDGVKVALGVGGKEWYDEFLRFKEALAELIRLRDALASGKHAGSLDSAIETDLATTQNRLERIKVLASEVGDSFSRWALPGINSAIDSAIDSVENWMHRKKSTGPGSLAGYEARFNLGDKPPRAPTPIFQDMPGAGLARKNWARQAQTPFAGISANTMPAFGRMQGMAPTLDLKSLNAAKAEIDIAGTALKGLDTIVSPKVNLDTGNATTQIGEVKSALQNLDATKAMPSVDVDISPAMAKIARVRDAISGLNSAIGASTSQVNSLANAVGSAGSKVGSLKATQNANFTASGTKGE